MCDGATTYWVINMLSTKITRQHDKNSTLLLMAFSAIRQIKMQTQLYVSRSNNLLGHKYVE